MSSLETEIYNTKLDIRSLELLETYSDPDSFIVSLDLCTMVFCSPQAKFRFLGPKSQALMAQNRDLNTRFLHNFACIHNHHN